MPHYDDAVHLKEEANGLCKAITVLEVNTGEVHPTRLGVVLYDLVQKLLLSFIFLFKSSLPPTGGLRIWYKIFSSGQYMLPFSPWPLYTGLRTTDGIRSGLFHYYTK